MTGSARVQEIEAKSLDVLIGQKTADLQVAKLKANEAEVVVRSMQIECDKRRVKVEEDAIAQILQSGPNSRPTRTTQSLIARRRRKQLNRRARSERKYELEWERLGILEHFAASAGAHPVNRAGDAARMVPKSGMTPKRHTFEAQTKGDGPGYRSLLKIRETLTTGTLGVGLV